MKRFILCRTDERAVKSPGRIVLYALLFFVATRVGCMFLLGAGAVFYKLSLGIDAMQMLRFGGDPTVTVARMGWMVLPLFLLGAPLFEECAFRLGLSFRRWQVAVGLGALIAFLVSRFAGIAGCEPWHWAAPAGVVVCVGLFFTTSDGFWAARREKWLCPMMWTSAALFGLVHLFAMQGLTWSLLPFGLLMCLMLFFAGCVLVYLRVNLGFGWAVGAHMLINLPGVVAALLLLTA